MINTIRYILGLPFIIIAIFSLVLFLLSMYLGFMITHGLKTANEELDYYIDKLSE